MKCKGWEKLAGICLLILGACSSTAAVQVPANTELEVRLNSTLSSSKSKEKDKVEGILIAPVVIDRQIVVSAGSKICGVVQGVRPAKAEERAQVTVQFDELTAANGDKVKISTRVISVEDARETVDDQGQIVGILASETISARLDQQLEKLGNSDLAGFLGAAKEVFMKAPQPDIDYSPGTEMTIKLLAAASFKEGPQGNRIPWWETNSSDAQLSKLVNAQPFQTVAQSPPKPSDITNLMFIGSRGHLEEAFNKAGWSAAAKLGDKSKLETIRAVAENRGYKEAPVSLLLLEGQPPDLVFEKLNNTFAKRHHLRIFHRPASYQGQEVWVCSATHDIGIDFSAENRTFIHKVDSSIDRERAKVVNDLLLTSQVNSVALVERPAVPKECMNATGDKLITDAKMAVLVLKSASVAPGSGFR
jgi:hypothetical protein